MAWAPDYCTSAELKTYIRLTVSSDDAAVALAITAASRAIDQFTNRQFGLIDAPETRHYTAEWDKKLRRWIIPIDDLTVVTGFSASVTAGALVTAFRPANASQTGRAYTSLAVDTTSTVMPLGDADEVTVTARWGWQAVPVSVKNATMIQAARIFKRKDAPFGISGSPDLQGEIRLLAKVDADVSVILQPFVRWWAAA